MKTAPLQPGAIIRASRLAVVFGGLIFPGAPNLEAAAPPTTLSIAEAGVDSEGGRVFQLVWDAAPDAAYRVQVSNDLTMWKTLDVVTPESGQGSFRVPSSIAGIAMDKGLFARLVLPQPEITGVEPAVVDVTQPGQTLYILGQCLPSSNSNITVVINGQSFTPSIVNSGGVWATVTLSGLPPGTAWLNVSIVDSGTGTVVATLPNSFLPVDASSPYLEGPPAPPPADPSGAWLSKKGYDYYQAQSALQSTGAQTNPAFQHSNTSGVMPDPPGGLFLSKKGYDHYMAQGDLTSALSSGGFFQTGDKITICHHTSSARKPYQIIRTSTAGCRDGHPEVMPFSGEVRLEDVDLAVPGRGLDFVWARTYRSRARQSASFGSCWTHSYDLHLQPLGGDILIHGGDGRADRFYLQSDGTFTCPGFFRVGTMTSGVFRLTFADTGYWEFNALGSAPSAGKIARIVDRNGNEMLFAYDTAGRLDMITDTLGRAFTVGYDTAGRPLTVTDFTGRAVTYAYYQVGEPGGSPGDLKSVTSPPVTGTPNGNDFPAGKTTTFTYSTGFADDRENHLLLTARDAAGTIKHEHVYQHNQTNLEFIRCISTKRWTDTATMLTYFAQTPSAANQFATLRCIINDPVGNVTECFYDARNRCVKMQEFTGRSTPGVPVTATVNRPAGQLRASDPTHFECRAEWNNDSLCSRLYLFGGQQMECLYESDFDKTTPARKRADLRVVREIASAPVDLDGDGAADVTERAWRFDYAPQFGTGEAACKWSCTRMARADYCGDDAVAFNVTKRNAITATQQNEAAAMKALVETAVARKGWDGTIKGRFAAGPRQSTSLVQDFEKNTENVSGGGGFVTSMTDPRGNLATTSYDTQGMRTQIALYQAEHDGLPPGVIRMVNFGYNTHGQLTSITHAEDANGRRRVESFEYYTSGLESGYIRIRDIDSAPLDGLHITTTFEYDPRGNVTRLIDPRGNDWLFTHNALDQCVRVRTPVNITARAATDFFYDVNDNLVQCATEVRDAADALIGSKVDSCIVDPLHRVTRVDLAVDATHQLSNEFVYDGNDQCVLVRGGAAVSGADTYQTVAFAYDERRLLFRTIGAPGSSVQSSSQCDYDANGNVFRVSEGLEGTPRTMTMEYDGFAGFGSSSPKIQGGVVAGFGEVEYSLMRGSGTTPLAGAVVPLFGEQTTKARKSCLRISKITDPMGNVTTFHFDACDNLKRVRHLGQLNDVAGSTGNVRLAESRYEYNSVNLRIRARDAFFDPVTQALIGDGERTTVFAFAPSGQCSSITDDLGRVTSYAYDTIGWPASVTSPGGKTVMVCLKDRAGNTTSITQTDRPDLGGPAQVFSRTNAYDSMNRCISTSDNVGNTSTCAYDSLSRMVKTTDPRGVSTFYAHDLLGRETQSVLDLDGNGVPGAADRSHTNYWVDADPRWPGIYTDSHGNSTSRSVDSLGRCTQVTQADGTRHSFAWNASSDLVSEQDANGTVVAHTYDLNGRCIANNYTFAPGSSVATTTTFEQFGYDGLSRLVSAVNDVSHSEIEYDSLSNDGGNHTDGWNLLSAFDSVGNRISVTYPGGRVLTFSHDVLDRCTNIAESGSSLVSYLYAGPGRVARMDYGNGTRAQFAYDGIIGTPNAPGDFGWGDVKSIDHTTTAGAARVLYACFRDAAGNTTSRAVTLPVPTSHTETTVLGYDNANRLVDSLTTSNSATLNFASYVIDRMGNRTSINRPFCFGAYTMDALVPGPLDFQMNQYTATPCDTRTYDENGNLTTASAGAVSSVSYGYDCRDRLVSVTINGALAATYAYDALGRRISKTVISGTLPPVTTTFHYDGGSVIEERVSGVIAKSFVLDGSRSTDDGVISRFDWQQVRGPIVMRSAGQDYFLHKDDIGNTLALTDAGGAAVEHCRHDDYGAVTFLGSDGSPTGAASSSFGNVYCWGDMRLDEETGLQNDDGGGYLDTQSGRAVSSSDQGNNVNWLFGDKTITGMANNPWSGGGGSTARSKQSEAKSNSKAMFTAKKKQLAGGGNTASGEPSNSINDVNR